MEKIPHRYQDIFTLFFNPGEICEIRAIGCAGKGPWQGWAKGSGLVFGYFNNPDDFAIAAQNLENAGPKGIYFTINPVMPDFLGRAHNRLKAADDKTKTTKDTNIAAVRWLLIDLDPIRAVGESDINTSNEEFKSGWNLRNRIHEDIRKERIAAKGIAAISGNGAHLMFRLPDLPPTETTTENLRAALQGIKERWGTPLVDIDQSVINPARIWKLYGTTARKSDHTPQRPQRPSWVQYGGDTCPILADIPVNDRILNELAKFAPKEEPPVKKLTPSKVLPIKRKPRGTTTNELGPVDVPKYLAHYGHNITHTKTGSKSGNSYTLYVLDHCLFNHDHKKEAGISQKSDGTLFYQCFHNTCKGYRFQDARAVISGQDSLAPFMEGFDPNYNQRQPQPHPHGRKQTRARVQNTSAAAASEETYPTPPIPFLRFNRQGRETLVPALAADYFESILYPVYCCGTENQFWQYHNSGAWQPLSLGKIKRTIREALADKAKPNWINQCVETMQAQCFRDEDEIDADPMYLNLKNGMWDVANRQLIPHNHTYNSRNQFPVNYDEDADCDLWVETLAKIFKDDPLKADTLQDFFGYCLYPKILFPGVLFMIGDGGNGKGVIEHVLTEFLGHQSVCHIPIKRMSEPFALIGFRGKHINTVSETSPDKLDMTDFKAVSSGDPIQAPVKYGRDACFVPYTKHYLSMNKFPRMNETTNSVFRRITVIECIQKFRGKDDDPYLKEKLSGALDGVFLWAIEGLYRVLRNKCFTTPESLKN